MQRVGGVLFLRSRTLRIATSDVDSLIMLQIRGRFEKPLLLLRQIIRRVLGAHSVSATGLSGIAVLPGLIDPFPSGENK